MTPIIEFKNYTFKYRSQSEPTLREIDLTVNPGEKVLIVGPSGSGKSTLVHCINGMVPFSYPGESSGTLTVGGKDPAKTGIFGMSKIVGTVLQDTDGQFIGLTVGEDIAFSLENDCVPQDKMKQVVDRWAKELDLGDLLKQASLRQVSLFDLAQHYGLPDPEGFARKFAAYERERLGENANE